MRFDDRLLTVLNQPAAERRDIAVRWRQLVDLVARAGANAGNATVTQALESIRADAPNVEEALRAAAARAVAALPLPLALLEVFASDSLSVAAPVLAAASLEPSQWAALIAVADDETRRFIETLHPELRDAPADLTEQLVAPAPVEPAPNEPAPSVAPSAPSLHELVERIERRRRARALHRRGGPPATGEASNLFRWESGPGGEIAWVDGAPRGALIGRSIARPQPGEGEQIDPQVVRAFTLRAPFRDATLTLTKDGPLAGEWKISGVPAFEPTDGRFAGYRGIALRDAPESAAAAEAPEFLPDPDSLRELVHEVKTPLNAILGFAEIIEGQYLGPAERPYRERASEIVRQAGMLLTAIDDLDFCARVRSGGATGAARADLTQLINHLAPGITRQASARGVELEVSSHEREAVVASDPALADRLIHRLASSIIEQAQAGERLRLWIGNAGPMWRVTITRPASLAALTDAQLLGRGSSFDQGFPLRLVRGLARIGGAGLTMPEGLVALSFPRA